MPLPINIEDLLRKQKIESNRIEFKRGWNPDSIYHSICAFANDLDNIGGGYILVGVEEDEYGIAKRPVTGIPIESLNRIQRDMVGFNNKIDPYYMPRVDVEKVDGRYVLAIWVPTGANRPYSVRERVTATNSSPVKWYVRSGTSSVEAKGEVMDELRDLASRVPFDDRGNQDIAITDISPALVLDYLQTVGSRLADEFTIKPFGEILNQMDLLVGPSEKRMVKNVAAMMFCNTPAKFFPVTQVDIVVFPEGCIKNPNKMIEVPPIMGTIPQMIHKTLDYLRTNVIKQQVIKPKDKAESIKYFNYPYQAFEEAVVNALYHRDYREREPVEITIEPDKVSILSYSGPDRSISMESIQKAERLTSRRYRNRRLGDFLKELRLSEGRATGIPTIQDELRKNGSPMARIETDDDRSYFLIEIPCREGFEGIDEAIKDKNEAINEVINEAINDKHKNINEKIKENINKKELSLLILIAQSPNIKRTELMGILAVSRSTIERLLKSLSFEPLNLIEYRGSKKTGGYVLTDKGTAYYHSLNH